MSSRHLEEVLLSQRGGRRVGGEISFLCPFHADTDPSCRWNSRKGVWYCHGCGASGGENKLLEALGLPVERHEHDPPPGWPVGVPTELKGARTVLYTYRGLDGQVLGYVARSDPPAGKIVYPYFGRENGRWKAAAAKRPRPLYGQERLIKYPDETVFVAEGEKCVDALVGKAAEGLRHSDARVVAVTSPGGSSAWRAADWSPLAGRRVVIWPDNDGPGIDYMHGVAGVLAGLGCEVSAINPSTLGLGPGGDCVDWLVAAEGIGRADDLEKAKEDVLSIPTVDPSLIKKPKTEKEKKARKAKAPPAPPPVLEGLHELTDLGNAERLRDRHGEDVKFASGPGWMRWDGKKWCRDPDLLGVGAMAAETARSIRQEALTCQEPEKFALVAKHAVKSESSARIRAMVELLAPMVEVPAEAFDADDWLLDTPTGVLDVRTGELLPHDRKHMCTMLTGAGYDPAAEAPRWQRFLGEVLPDPEVRQLLQRWAGSCLTGVAKDRVLMLATGTGHNGKGVLIETLAHVLGDYAHAVSQRFVARRSNDPIPPHELALLRGKRLVFGAELKPDVPMDVELLKGLTGGDTIQACHKYQTPFSFRPKCKIFVSSNHRPPIHDQTASIWDRLRIIRFPNEFKRGVNRDERLLETLKGEGSGILRWMLEGALAWQRDGLGSALSIDLETDDERRAQDPLDDFFREVAVLHEEGRVTNADLYEAYKRWAEEEGIKKPWSRQGLGRALAQRPGIKQKRTAMDRIWVGLALRDGRSGPARTSDLSRVLRLPYAATDTGDDY